MEAPSITQIPIVNEFLDMFSDESSGMPPDKKREFCIDLVCDTQPMFVPPYRMAPAKQREIKEQLQKLLDKGFICPSTSPKGAMVLFVKKKDGSLMLCVDYR